MKNYVLFFRNMNIIATSFEIRNSTGKLHKDFRTLFVFKHRRKTKKFTLKWQITLIEKRVEGGGVTPNSANKNKCFWDFPLRGF